MQRLQRLKNLKGPLIQGLVGLAMFSLIGGEYYRYTLTTRAADQERKAQEFQRQVQDLRVREQKLQPDLALMEELDRTLINPKDGNLSQQLLARVLADEESAGAELRSLLVGQRGVLGTVTRHALTVQIRGDEQSLIAYMQALETGPAAARIAGLGIRQMDASEAAPGSATGPGEGELANLSIEYYSKPR